MVASANSCEFLLPLDVDVTITLPLDKSINK